MEQPVRRIRCESPEQKMWDLYALLENEPTVKPFLEEKYRRQSIDSPSRAAFQNTQAFIYHIKQARETYRAARQADLMIRPLLSYYGMMNLCKAWMLSRDPEYPRSTSVMRHGVSTRKRKKQGFRFRQDEVRIQQEGLFSEMARVQGWSRLIGEVFTVGELFALLPEVQDGYRQLTRNPSLFLVAVPEPYQFRDEGMPFYVEEGILDALHVTPRGLIDKLNRNRPAKAVYMFRSGEESALSHGRLRLLWSHPKVRHVDHWEWGFHHPFFREDTQGGYYLVPGGKRPLLLMPELFIHYLLLFSVSMLCRYETPLWGEMLYGFSSEDLLLIQEFLHVTQRKFPNLILNELFEEKLIFGVI
ncbi:hypothetical protein GCM10011571_04130 [Marinithermofilum abyssi]|uniref:YaaC-like Protein n=1 Tax=Marinithermofilum abyssi TaxID=1571185 RepID=A0A8J2VH82_9BACL|nr:YaaC family protein [Marinithermofilum abyssi]GGE06205.1 hypothetical protein GCM10011571_04130 [Marinithermofilum abyssi]